MALSNGSVHCFKKQDELNCIDVSLHNLHSVFFLYYKVFGSDHYSFMRKKGVGRGSLTILRVVPSSPLTIYLQVEMREKGRKRWEAGGYPGK